jgi:hypothetical protein
MTSAKTAPTRRILYVVGEDYWFLLSRLPMARAARDAGFEVHVATNVSKSGKAIEDEGFILHPSRSGAAACHPFRQSRPSWRSGGSRRRSIPT